MSAKALAKLGRRMIIASDGPLANGGGAGVSDEAPAAGACIGIAEAAGDVGFEAAGAEVAGGGALSLEHPAQAKPSNAIAESFMNRFTAPPGLRLVALVS